MYAQHALPFKSQSEESSTVLSSKAKETEVASQNKAYDNVQPAEKSMVTDPSAPVNRYPDDLKNVLQKGTHLDGPSVRTLRWGMEKSPTDATKTHSSATGKANALPLDITPASSPNASHDSDANERPLAQNLVENRQLRQQFVLQLQWLRDKQEEEERAGDVIRAQECGRLVQRIRLILEKLKQQVRNAIFPVELFTLHTINF